MSNPTSVLPDNAFLLWLQDEANNEYLTPQSLTQMYTHLAPQADDPLDVFKADDRTHSFLVFLKQRNTNQSRSHLLHHMSMLPPRVGQPAQHAGRYFLSSGDSIHNQFVTHELPADFLTTLLSTPSRLIVSKGQSAMLLMKYKLPLIQKTKLIWKTLNSSPPVAPCGFRINMLR